MKCKVCKCEVVEIPIFLYPCNNQDKQAKREGYAQALQDVENIAKLDKYNRMMVYFSDWKELRKKP